MTAFDSASYYEARGLVLGEDPQTSTGAEVASHARAVPVDPARVAALALEDPWALTPPAADPRPDIIQVLDGPLPTCRPATPAELGEDLAWAVEMGYLRPAVAS